MSDLRTHIIYRPLRSKQNTNHEVFPLGNVFVFVNLKARYYYIFKGFREVFILLTVGHQHRFTSEAITKEDVILCFE